MTIREIIKHPNKILRKTSFAVTDFESDEFKDLCRDLCDTVKEYKGAGLAAPQVGVLQRVFALGAGISGLEPRIVINPKVLEYSKTKCNLVEGCFSVERLVASIERPESITCEFITIEAGELKPMYLKDVGGMFARAFLHERDHLDGKLFFERIKDRNLRSRFYRA